MREPVHPDYPQLTAVLQHLLDSGGKRLRPALALLAGSFYTAAGSTSSDNWYPWPRRSRCCTRLPWSTTI